MFCMRCVAGGDSGGFGGERYETTSMQTNVRSAFQTHFVHQPKWRVLDGAQSMEALQEQIWKMAQQTITTIAQKPIDLIQ
jgi:thymidylate kinase